MPVNTAILQEYVTTLLKERNELCPPERRIDMSSSSGWMSSFQKRYKLKFRQMHGETGSADHAMTSELPDRRRLISQYPGRAVFNADEFSVLYRLPSTRTLSSGPVEGVKKDKSRIRFLGCCKSDGYEKYPLMVIGKFCKHSPFRLKSC